MTTTAQPRPVTVALPVLTSSASCVGCGRPDSATPCGDCWAVLPAGLQESVESALEAVRVCTEELDEAYRRTVRFLTGATR